MNTFGYAEIREQILKYPDAEQWNRKAVDSALKEGRINSQENIQLIELLKSKGIPKSGESDLELLERMHKTCSDIWIVSGGTANREFFEKVRSEGLPASKVIRVDKGETEPENKYIYAVAVSTIAPPESMSLLNVFRAYGGDKGMWFRISLGVLTRSTLRNETDSKYGFQVEGKNDIIKFLREQGIPDWVAMQEISAFEPENQRAGEPELIIPKPLPPAEIVESFFGMDNHLRRNIKEGMAEGAKVRSILRNLQTESLEETITLLKKPK